MKTILPSTSAALALGAILAIPQAATLGTRVEARVGAAGGVEVTAVSTVGFTVSDLDRAVDFYTRVLAFAPVSELEVAGEAFERLHGVFGARARVARLRLGLEQIELTEYRAPRGKPMPADSRGNDRWFQHVAIIVSDMDRAYARLREHGVAHASSGPQRLPDWNANAAGIRAFYFRDPDGHFLEILSFPTGKGHPRWHGAGTALFLGIDHTAIVVSDTDASLGLYRDVLGLVPAGESENHGPEQERLNHVFGARLRITTLRAAAGPGVELLEYRAPRDGRPTPADLRANDVAHWQTTVVTADPAPMLERSRFFALVSPDVVTMPDDALGFARGILVRDPDGHGVRVVSGLPGTR
jgi:catechol 2,3-dioxygenase-like lactoylglutathione lyase family enzyme